MTARLTILLWLVICAAVGFSAEIDHSERVHLRAQDQYDDGTTWKGVGEIHITYQDITITCDEAEWNRATNEVVARGRIVVDRGPSRFTADELRFNLTTKTGVFTNATAQIDPMYSFSGRRIEKLDDTHYRIDRAIFTTCDPEGRPPWSFSIRKALVEEEGYGRFTSAAIRVQNVPVFYLPYIVWPIKQDRAPGLLMPRFGYSDRRGFNIGLPVYIPIGRSYDTTILADYYTKGFWGLGNSWRWAPVTGATGDIEMYTVNDRESGDWQWKYFGVHKQKDLLGFELLAQLEDLSDIDFWQDFDRSFEGTTRRSLKSFAFLTRRLGPYSLNVSAARGTTFYSANEVVLSSLPEVEVRSTSTAIAGSQFYLNLISSLGLLRADRGSDLVGTYGRADLFPTVSYTLPGPVWLSVTPRIGGRATYYTKQYAEDRLSFDDQPIERLYFTGAIDIVGPSISRLFEGGIGKYEKVKHIIEPRFEYRYLTTPTDVRLIPIFDEVDSTPRDANFVRLVLSNQLLGRSREGVGSRELAVLDLMQDFSFGAPLTQGSAGRTSKLGPLSAALRLTPTTGITVDGRVSYDTLHRNLISTKLTTGLQQSLGMLNLTWYENFSPQTGEKISSQTRGMIAFRKSGVPLEVAVQVAYDIVNRKVDDQRFRFSYQGTCWNVSAEYRDTRLGVFPTREFLIVIGLKGVGSLPEIRGSLGAP